MDVSNRRRGGGCRNRGHIRSPDRLTSKLQRDPIWKEWSAQNYKMIVEASTLRCAVPILPQDPPQFFLHFPGIPRGQTKTLASKWRMTLRFIFIGSHLRAPGNGSPISMSLTSFVERRWDLTINEAPKTIKFGCKIIERQRSFETADPPRMFRIAATSIHKREIKTNCFRYWYGRL